MRSVGELADAIAETQNHTRADFAAPRFTEAHYAPNTWRMAEELHAALQRAALTDDGQGEFTDIAAIVLHQENEIAKLRRDLDSLARVVHQRGYEDAAAWQPG